MSSGLDDVGAAKNNLKLHPGEAGTAPRAVHCNSQVVGSSDCPTVGFKKGGSARPPFLVAARAID